MVGGGGGVSQRGGMRLRYILPFSAAATLGYAMQQPQPPTSHSFAVAPPIVANSSNTWQTQQDPMFAVPEEMQPPSMPDAPPRRLQRTIFEIRGKMLSKASAKEYDTRRRWQYGDWQRSNNPMEIIDNYNYLYNTRNAEIDDAVYKLHTDEDWTMEQDPTAPVCTIVVGNDDFFNSVVSASSKAFDAIDLSAYNVEEGIEMIKLTEEINDLKLKRNEGKLDAYGQNVLDELQSKLKSEHDVSDDVFEFDVFEGLKNKLDGIQSMEKNIRNPGLDYYIVPITNLQKANFSKEPGYGNQLYDQLKYARKDGKKIHFLIHVDPDDGGFQPSILENKNYAHTYEIVGKLFGRSTKKHVDRDTNRRHIPIVKNNMYTSYISNSKIEKKQKDINKRLQKLKHFLQRIIDRTSNRSAAYIAHFLKGLPYIAAHKRLELIHIISNERNGLDSKSTEAEVQEIRSAAENQNIYQDMNSDPDSENAEIMARVWQSLAVLCLPLLMVALRTGRRIRKRDLANVIANLKQKFPHFSDKQIKSIVEKYINSSLNNAEILNKVATEMAMMTKRKFRARLILLHSRWSLRKKYIYLYLLYYKQYIQHWQ